MQSPYGFGVQENCLTCVWREKMTFCNLAGAALRHLQRITTLSVYPAGTVLYAEGKPCRQVFILCNGRAKIFTSSREHSVVMFKMAHPGEVLGLEAVLCQQPYEETAELLDPCQVKAINRRVLLDFLEHHNPPAVHAALQLAANSRLAREQIRRIGLSVSGTQKLARLLISWARTRGMRGTAAESFDAPYTHEGIAQMIGSTRETVTRVLSRLKQQNIITINGDTFVINDFDYLKRLAHE